MESPSSQLDFSEQEPQSASSRVELLLTAVNARLADAIAEQSAARSSCPPRATPSLRAWASRTIRRRRTPTPQRDAEEHTATDAARSRRGEHRKEEA